MENSNSNVQMSIAFKDESQHCYETNGSNVVVQVEPRSSNSQCGSSMVKLKNIIGYKWEKKNYPGHLVAIHKEGKIVAYSINVNGQGMVRLIHFGMGNKRALIKGMAKEVLDLQFADYSKEVIIGSIEESALHVHKLEVIDSDSIQCIQLLKIENPIPDHVPKLDKISWCPYLPEGDETDDEFSVMLLVWVRGNKFECYSVKTILETYKAGVHQAKEITDGLVRSYEENRALITHATFSPDGTTLAISTDDGSIQFYQIYFHETTPRCLHTWSPHDGASISSFFFLDNHTQPITGSSLWKYAVTLAADNTEIKISKCDNWKTLQTIKFQSPLGLPLSFKAEIDRTSSYLILSDMNNRQMYVLQILKENALDVQNGSEDHVNGNENGASGGIARVFVNSIAEFDLASQVLSYGISNASIRRQKCALSDNFMIDELEDYDEENNSVYGVVLRLFMILPESMQECQILYKPVIGEIGDVSTTSISQQLNSSVSSTTDSKKSEVSLKTPPQKAAPLNLLTPDSFSSPVEKPKDVSQEVLSTIFMLAKTNQVSPAINTSFENVLNLTNCSLLEEEKLFQQKMPAENNLPTGKSGAASGGSSPSREVRDILLKADSVNEDYYPGEDSDDLENVEEQSKDVLNALNALDVDFKNIDDDDDDDDDDGNEEDDEDDEPAKVTTTKPIAEWPQAPQFIDPSSAPATSKQVETLSTRMNQMIEIMEQQSRYIAELRNEIYVLKGQTSAEAAATQMSLTKLEDNCKKSIEQHYIKTERHLQMNESTSVNVLQQISHNQATLIETKLKENLLKICTHKAFVESISQSLLNGFQKQLEHVFKKYLEDAMLPNYERITREMYMEMAKSFAAGTKEYTRAFEMYMKQYGAVQFQISEFATVVHSIPENIQTTSEKSIIPHLNSGFLDIRQRIEKFHVKFIHEVMDQVKAEIKNGFERQTTTLEDSVLSVVQRSQAETPAPTIYDHQESIKHLLVHGEINKAFHQALISSDLSLLEYTIEKADINKVFNPCPLEQTVLMSLIQQLTADMSKYNDTKNSYLNEAVLCLRMIDPLTKEHAPKILYQLNHTFQEYLSAHPNSPFSSSMRMMMIAAQSMVRA